MNHGILENVTSRRAGIGVRELVVLAAALMASTALAIDAMIPALPAISETLGIREPNQRQLVITAFLLGFGFAQIAYGPLSDRFGRKPLLIGSLFLYCVFATLAGLAGSFELLIMARVMQGVAAAGNRVLVMAIVRDQFQGPAMARIMSLVTIVFMIVPVLAPSFGQAVLVIATWRHIFIGLGIYGAVLLLWSLARLPETLKPEYRLPLSASHIGEAIRTTLVTRQSIGNALAATLAFAGLFAQINSIQQIVHDVFGRGDLLAFVFALIVLPMAISSYINSRLVFRIGSKHLLIGALICFTLVAAVHLTIALTMDETIWLFVAMQAILMACFGPVGANANALAMQPLGHIAGTASSMLGVITTVGGALIGFMVGQLFDGTVIPLLSGFALCGALALAFALWANRQII